MDLWCQIPQNPRNTWCASSLIESDSSIPTARHKAVLHTKRFKWMEKGEESLRESVASTPLTPKQRVQPFIFGGRTNWPALSAEMDLAARPRWREPAGRGGGGPRSQALSGCGKSSSPPDLHFIQITGKVLLKTEPLLLAKTLGLLGPEQLPQVSGRSPAGLTSPSDPGFPPQLFGRRRPPCTLMHTYGWSSGERKESLQRGSGLQALKWVTGPR